MERKIPMKHVHACYYCKKSYRISRMYVTYYTGWEHNWDAIPPEWVKESRVDTCPVCYERMGYVVRRGTKMLDKAVVSEEEASGINQRFLRQICGSS